MYQSDWILRQIELVGAVLKRLVSAIREQRPDEALELAEEAIGELMGGDPSLADVLSGEGLVSMLSAGGELDLPRALALAETLRGRAEAREMLEDQLGAALDLGRAEALLVAARDAADEDAIPHIEEMLDHVRVGD